MAVAVPHPSPTHARRFLLEGLEAASQALVGAEGALPVGCLSATEAPTARKPYDRARGHYRPTRVACLGP
jgi:hypothetical protein